MIFYKALVSAIVSFLVNQRYGSSGFRNINGPTNARVAIYAKERADTRKGFCG